MSRIDPTLILGIVSLVINAITLYFLILYARDTRRLANDTRTLAKSSLQQLTFSERPFIAWISQYDDDDDLVIGYAHNQGSGPALDLEGTLRFNGEHGPSDYSIGCLPAGEKFHFKIGGHSSNVASVRFKYKSISGHPWRTEVTLSGGMSICTKVFDDGAQSEHSVGE